LSRANRHVYETERERESGMIVLERRRYSRRCFSKRERESERERERERERKRASVCYINYSVIYIIRMRVCGHGDYAGAHFSILTRDETITMRQ